MRNINQEMTMKNLSAPCKECAFRRDSEPGYLGGSPVETFVGQVFGPFVIPCHCACDFEDPSWKDKVFETPQCAGTAIFRANLDLDRTLPPQLHQLPSDHKLVFTNPAEFMAHHKGIGVAEAEQILKTPGSTIVDLRDAQLSRADNRYKGVGQ